MSERQGRTLDAALEALCAADGGAVLVGLDFDGVLAPLVDDPTASRMTAATRSAVDRLATLARRGHDSGTGAPGSARVRLAFVSGRDLADLVDRADPPPGAYLVGSHGAQTGHVRTDGQLESVPLELSPEQSSMLADLYDALGAAADGRQGVWVQRKPSAAVLHTRTASAADTEAAQAAADAAADRLGLHAMHGKDVVEIAVVKTSKGDALQRLRTVVARDLGADQVRVLYAGDDTTDEKAFAVLGSGDVTVKVGDGDTCARHRVAGTEDVAAMIEQVAEALAPTS